MRAVALGIVSKVEVKRHKAGGRSPAAAAVDRGKIFYRGEFIKTTIYDRAGLAAGNVVPGPAVITQNDATTLILPGHYGEVDAYLNILIWPNGHSKNKPKISANGHARKK